MTYRDTLDYYMDDIRFFPKQISADEELELIIGVKAGAPEACEKFFLPYLWQVVIEARKRFYGQELAELVQLGNLGLMHALKKYDSLKINPETGRPYRFLTYATKWIVNFMTRGWSKLNKDSFVSLNAHISDGDSDELITELESTSDTFLEASGNDLSDRVDIILNQLDERERDIIKRSFGIGYDRAYTLREIAPVFSISHARVHQIQSKALKKLEALMKIE